MVTQAENSPQTPSSTGFLQTWKFIKIITWLPRLSDLFQHMQEKEGEPVMLPCSYKCVGACARILTTKLCHAHTYVCQIDNHMIARKMALFTKYFTKNNIAFKVLWGLVDSRWTRTICVCPAGVKWWTIHHGCALHMIHAFIVRCCTNELGWQTRTAI